MRIRNVTLVVCLIVSLSCSKTDAPQVTPTPPPVPDEKISFSIQSIDTVNTNIITTDSISLSVTLLSKIPTNGVTYSIKVVDTSNTIIYSKDLNTTNTSVTLIGKGYQIGKNFTTNISVTSNSNTTNTASKIIIVKRNRLFINYKRPSYELQGSDPSADILQIRSQNGKSNSNVSFSATSFLDLNGDGVNDIYIQPVTNSQEKVKGEVYINKNGAYNNDQTFIDSTQVPSMYLARKSIIGDYNNDSIPDIFLGGFGPDLSPFSGENNVLLLSKNGKYIKKEFVEKIGGYHGVCSGDIDNNGDLDIFALSNDKSYFLLNDGAGNFTYSTKELNLTTLASLFTCELFDVNKDGYLDLILGGHEFMVTDTTFTKGSGYEGATRIYWGSSTGKFNESNVSYLPVQPDYGVVLDIDFADLDGDGKYEIALSRAGGKMSNGVISNFYVGWDIQILKFNGSKWVDKTDTFIEKYNSTTEKEIVWMRFQDIDNNGKIDYCSMKLDVTNVRWELQNGKLVRIF